MSEQSFVKRAHPRCQQGITWLYQLSQPLPVAVLCRALQNVYAGKLVVSEQWWGKRRVVRMILQFQLELRLGQREGEVRLEHRVCASGATRARHHEILEGVLRRLSVEG